MEASTPAPTITNDKLIEATCEHCAATTMQVLGGSGLRTGGSCESACLQCIADGGTCCSLKPLDRRAV